MSVGTDRDESSRSRRGVYGISVASELSGFGMQALRLYEQHGLVTPARTEGGTRRYSDDDLLRLERIAELIEAGVNLVGIRRVLDLESRTGELERDNRRLEAANARLREERRRAMHDPFDIAPEADRIEQDLPADLATCPRTTSGTGHGMPPRPTHSSRTFRLARPASRGLLRNRHWRFPKVICSNRQPLPSSTTIGMRTRRASRAVLCVLRL